MKIWQTAAVAAPLVTLTLLAPVTANASTTAGAPVAARTCNYQVIRVHTFLNVRAHPDINSKVVFRLRNGQKVSGDCMTRRHDGRTWVHLLKPHEGWADGRYLKRI